MTERTSRWSAENLQRIYSDRYGGDDQSVARLARSYISLLDENERLRAAQTTTLVACSRCGHGQRARHMVASGDERLCVECAGVEMGRLRKRVGRYGSSFLEALLSDDDEKSMFWHVLDPKLKEGLRAALHAAADAQERSDHERRIESFSGDEVSGA